jgi:hypothetical protein
MSWLFLFSYAYGLGISAKVGYVASRAFLLSKQ